MGRVAAVAVFVFVTVMLAGCGGSPTASVSSTTTTESAPTVPTLGGIYAHLVAEVDCGVDGVADVHIEFGKVDDHILVGRNPTTQSIGGQQRFSMNYGVSAGSSNVPFTITTSPTTGTCITTLTNYNTGDIIGQKETAGRARLKVIFEGEG